MSIFNKHSTPTFSENIKRYRKEAGLSQEELASRMGLTPQAISKWECGLSYPDVTLLLPLAELFGITADEMLRGVGSAVPVEKEADVEVKQTETISTDDLENNDILQDDGVLRVVQCLGRRILRVHELDTDLSVNMTLPEIEAPYNVRVMGNATVNGDLVGDLKAGGVVNCDAVTGNVHAGADVNCDGIAGNVTAGCDVNCDEVGGNVTAGCDVKCDEVGGNARAGVSLTASTIKGDAKSGGNLMILNN